jgi:iron complex transport system substrate-binding protein
MKRIVSFALAFCLVFFVSCEGVHISSDEGAVTFTDDTGKTVSVGKPHRVAVLFSSFAEIWTLAGGEISITVGEAVERGFADETALLVDSGAGKKINTELLLSYLPDFILYSADIPAQAEAAGFISESMGIPAAGFRVETFSDYLRVLKICTDVTGNEKAYEVYGEDVLGEIDSIRSCVPAGEEKKILFIRAGETVAKAKTAEEHFACVMLNELGTYNIAEGAKVLLDGLSVEEVLMQNPEMIFVSSMGNEDAAKRNVEALLSEGAWQTLDAVKNGRIYFLPKDLFQYKPNARWAEAYRYLTEILYDNET